MNSIWIGVIIRLLVGILHSLFFVLIRIFGLWKVYWRRFNRRFFYPAKDVCRLIFDFDGEKIENDEFIAYKSVLSGDMYSDLGMNMCVHWNGQEKIFRLPYVECIDFISDPNVKLIASGQKANHIFTWDLYTRTEAAFCAYRVKRPYRNEFKLCLRGLYKESESRYRCDVRKTDFESIIRTNLTLDYWSKDFLKGDGNHAAWGETLRAAEMDMANGGIPELQDSLLVNFIGVSAIWCLDAGEGEPNERYSFYLKPRKQTLSVYPGMLGTVSGYVDAKEIQSDDLLKYVKTEILREFEEETGYCDFIRSFYEDAKIEDLTQWERNSVKIIPLALTRELIRGGVPQFFLLIVTPAICVRDMKRFARFFRLSKDGKNEFLDTFKRIRQYPLSPETLMNLLYVYKYIHRKEHHSYIRLG